MVKKNKKPSNDFQTQFYQKLTVGGGTRRLVKRPLPGAEVLLCFFKKLRGSKRPIQVSEDENDCTGIRL